MDTNAEQEGDVIHKKPTVVVATITQPTAAPSKASRVYWPLPLPLVLALLPLLPTECFLNRGYTQWFHWTAVIYFFTRTEFLRKFCVIQGAGVCVGWYVALLHEYAVHGRAADVLYQNMPTQMTSVMAKQQHDNDDDDALRYSNQAVCMMMMLSHLLDLMAHPVLTFTFWRIHYRAYTIKNAPLTLATATPAATDGAWRAWRDVCTWPVLGSTFLLSRVWSVTQSYYNFGQPALYYFGFDVYVIDSLDVWLPAYAAEGVLYLIIVLYKLLVEENSAPAGKAVRVVNTTTTTTVTTPKPPNLIASISGVSIVSTDDDDGQ
jgi:hypothetical protein